MNTSSSDTTSSDTTGRTWTRRNVLGYGAAAVATANLHHLFAGPSASAEESSGGVEVQLSGLTVRLAKPRWVVERDHEWDHGQCLFPDLLRFSTGELMLNHSLNRDSNENAHNSQAVYLSFDEGKTFNFSYDVNGFHNSGGEPRVALPDGRIVGTSTFLKPEPPDQARRFVAHRWTYDQGGRRYQVEPWSVVVEGLPRDVRKWSKPSRTWWSHINWFSDIVPLDNSQTGKGRWISTISLRFDGDKLESTVAVASDDEGRHWQYLATIANQDSVPDAEEGFDEPCLLQLADGDLMCVSRVGGAGAHQKLARTYSADGGQTWSAIDRLPAYAVAPQMVRTSSGVLALSTGRPGLFLWLADDPRGTNWQMIDVMAHHNAVLPPEETMHAGSTTAYTALVLMPDDRIMLVYDRRPVDQNSVPAGSLLSNRDYMLEIEIRRT